MWGNFKIDYMDNELAQVDRGLYGANAHYGSEATTSFGEKRIAIDGFAGAPGHQGNKPIGSYTYKELPIDRWDPVAARIGR